MTRASKARRKRGAPKKDFSTDRDRTTIDIVEVLHLFGFDRGEAYDIALAIREGKLIETKTSAKRLALGFRLPVTVEGRIETLRKKNERESTAADSLRRSLLAVWIMAADRAMTQENATRLLDRLLALAAISGVEKLRQAVEALARQSMGERRKRRRVAKKTH